MTFKVAKSQMPENFEANVALHAHEMRLWRAHMIRVEQDKLKPDLEPIKRHVAHPRPDAHPLVEASVNENDDADYEIIDDLPTPEQQLAMKKERLHSIVHAAEVVAIAAVVPFGKRRAFLQRQTEIGTSDAAIISGLAKKGIMAKIADKVGITDPIDVVAELKKRRTPADQAFLEQQAERHAKIDAIHRAATQMYADIEDLTAETIGAWQLPDFPK